MTQAQERKTDLILEEIRKRNSRRSVVDVEEEKIKIVAFSQGGYDFAFHGSDIKEILNRSDITYVPGTPEFILGVINVRGDIESVIDILKLFGLDPAQAGTGRLIALAGKDGMRSGILMDMVEDVVDIPANSIRPPLSTLNGRIREVVSGEVICNGKSFILLDTGKLFSCITV